MSDLSCTLSTQLVQEKREKHLHCWLDAHNIISHYLHQQKEGAGQLPSVYSVQCWSNRVLSILFHLRRTYPKDLSNSCLCFESKCIMTAWEGLQLISERRLRVRCSWPVTISNLMVLTVRNPLWPLTFTINWFSKSAKCEHLSGCISKPIHTSTYRWVHDWHVYWYVDALICFVLILYYRVSFVCLYDVYSLFIISS